jgi:hypothetical protein
MEDNGTFEIKTLLNFMIDELKEIKADIREVKSEMVTKKDCEQQQENCPASNIESSMEKKTNLILKR